MDPERNDDEVVVGWRSWRWHPTTGNLFSLVWWTPWAPFRRMEATYHGRTSAVPGMPNLVGDNEVSMRSVVGFHAWRECSDLDRIIKFDEGYVPVWGEVSLWGKVVECEHGWRGEFAYPLSFLLLEQHLEHAPVLAGAYGVEARAMM